MSDRRQRMQPAAERVGHNWLGVEHAVLALLDVDDTSPAAIALRACGITWDAYAQAVAALPEEYAARPGVPGGLEWSRELSAMEAKAEGLALGMGSAVARSEHLLLAILWERTPPVALQILRRHFGITRGQILAKLVEMGVDIPRVPLPPDFHWSEPRLVSSDEFKRLQAQYSKQGVQYGCNQEGDKIRVFTAQFEDA